MHTNEQKICALLTLLKVNDVIKQFAYSAAEEFLRDVSDPRARNNYTALFNRQVPKCLGAAFDAVAALYCARYSVEEIDQLLEFYSSPLGQKWLEEGDWQNKINSALRSWWTTNIIEKIEKPRLVLA